MMGENSILENLNNYFVIATLLMPAIIMITIRRWVTPINCNFFQDVYKFIGYGMFNFIIFCVIAKLCNWSLTNNVLNIDFILQKPSIYLCFTILLPIVLGLFLASIDRLQIIHHILELIFRKKIETNGLTAWEEFFGQNPRGNINVTLNDGTQVIGYFDSSSMVSSSIEYKDIYIKKVKCIGNHSFDKDISMWLPIKDIKYILFDESEELSMELLIAQNSSCIIDLGSEINQLKQEVIKLKNELKKGEEND